MKILFFIDCLTSGGKERRLVELMKVLKLSGNADFELVVMSNEIHYQEVFDLKINIHYLIRTTKKDMSVFGKFYKICRQYNPDIVHCWDSMTAIYSIPACKLLHIKFVNGMVADAPRRQNFLNKSWLRAKLTFPFSNIILANSKAGLTAYQVPIKKSFFIHNGFNFERINSIPKCRPFREQLQIDKEKYVIGMVASFSKYKDYQTFFKAAHQLLRKRTDIIFLAIGKDTDSDLCKNLIEVRYKEHFRLLGKKSGIESFIEMMDIGILSTFTEGLSNSILEYMALGKPVIASTGGGTNEIVEDNKTGFLIPPSDPDQLAEKIEILLNDAELRKKMGIAGQERIKKEFTIDRMVNKYMAFYQSLVKNNSIFSKILVGE
jgi:glycosyltransferase involved in cell wall biosynthesis